jgi:hypothetical protein
MPLVLPKPVVDGIGNVVNGLVSGLALDPDTRITCNPEYSLGVYDTVFHPRHIYHGGPQTPFWTFRLLVLKTEEADQVHTETEFRDIQTCGQSAFSDRVAIDMNYDPARLSEAVRTRICSTVQSLEFLPCIPAWVEAEVSRFTPATTLGVSVRTWTAPHETNIHRAYSAAVYKEAIQKALTPEITHVALSVDNDAHTAEYLEFLKDFPVTVVLLDKRPEQNDLQHVAVKMLALSRCATVIGSRMSTFTELVFWFGMCRPKMIPLF